MTFSPPPCTSRAAVRGRFDPPGRTECLAITPSVRRFADCRLKFPRHKPAKLVHLRHVLQPWEPSIRKRVHPSPGLRTRQVLPPLSPPHTLSYPVHSSLASAGAQITSGTPHFSNCGAGATLITQSRVRPRRTSLALPACRFALSRPPGQGPIHAFILRPTFPPSDATLPSRTWPLISPSQLYPPGNAAYLTPGS